MQKDLNKMSAQERREWAEQRHAELTEFKAYTQRYLTNRAYRQSRGRGKRTETDERYEAFQTLADNLLLALAFIQSQAAQEEEGEE